jgi:HK97 family phage portal protein
MAALSLRSVLRWPFGGRLPIGAITEMNRLPPINWVDCNTCGPTCAPYATPFAVPAFLACVRVISEGVASLPKRLIRRLADGSRRPDTEHWCYRLLHDAPNPWQSSFEFFEGLAGDVAAFGNHYSVKQYGDGGEIVALLPLEPWRVSVSQLESQMLVYDYVAPSGEGGRFRDDQILHVRGMSRDGITGECPVQLLTGPLGLASVMERYSTRFWSNNAKPGMVLETAQPIPREALVEVLRQFEAAHRGADNAGKTAALPVGVTVRSLDGASAQAEQMVEMRTFIIQEIARAMRVPPSLIGENSRSTFSNAEQEQLSWVTNSLAMWCRRIEGAFNRSIIREIGPDLEMHIDVRGLLRGDSAARAAYYQTMFQLAALSPAEIRSLEDMPPVSKPGMDDYYVPVNNYAPIGSAPPAAPAADAGGPPAGFPPGRSLRGSPDQPRDDAGRWTSGGGGAISQADYVKQVSDTLASVHRLTGDKAAPHVDFYVQRREAQPDWYKSLSHAEEERVWSWRGRGYEDIRSDQKLGKESTRRAEWEAAIEKAPEVEGDFYRGLSGWTITQRDIDQFQPGATITLDADSSASKSQAYAHEHSTKLTSIDPEDVGEAWTKETRPGLVLKFEGTKGRDISDLRSASMTFAKGVTINPKNGEEEVILRRGSQYTVHSVEGRFVVLRPAT